jgi:hypothetical protein
MVHAGAIDEVAGRFSGVVGYRIEVHEHAERARRVFDERQLDFDEEKPGVFEVCVNGGQAGAADLLEQLVLRGARVSSLGPKESAIEAVYRKSAASKVA